MVMMVVMVMPCSKRLIGWRRVGHVALNILKWRRRLRAILVQAMVMVVMMARTNLLATKVHEPGEGKDCKTYW